jgi:DNA-binding transcriptional LysR family regulator
MTSLVVFAQVVESASFSAAARRLGLGVPAVSKHVAQLEARLGAQLLHRTTRRLSLTEVGRGFYERCVRIVRELKEAELAVSRVHAEPQGLLRVNAPMSFGQLWLAPVMARFLDRHPKTRIDLALDDRLVNPVEGGFDVTIRVAALADSSLVARRLAPNRVVVCGSDAYLARRGIPRTPGDLTSHNCLLYAYLSSRDAWHFVGPAGEEWVTVEGTLRANNGDVLREAAVAGVGLVQMPSFIVGPELARGALRAVLQPYEDRTLSVWALYPPTRYLAPKVRAFVDLLAHSFVRPAWDATPRRRATATR